MFIIYQCPLNNSLFIKFPNSFSGSKLSSEKNMKPFSPDIVIFGTAVVITGPALLAGPEFGCVNAYVSVPFNYFFPC